MQTTIFPKNDYPIPRGTLKQCQVCFRPFSIFLREHQCKRCFRAVCNKCGAYHSLVYKIGYTKHEHRVCQKCKESSEFISMYIKNKKLKFGTLSQIGEKWFNKIAKHPNLQGQQNSKQKLLTKQVFFQLWDSYNPQLRQFIGMMTFDYQQNSLYQAINTAYSTIICLLPNEKIQSIVYLIVFLLCYCSLDRAIVLVVYLFELKSKIKNPTDGLLSCLKELPFNQQLAPLMKYILYRIQRHFPSFMINAVPIEAINYLLTKIFERKSCEELFYFFASHLYTNKSALVKIGYNPSLSDFLMVRECKIEEIYSNYKYCKNKNLLIIVGETTKSAADGNNSSFSTSLGTMEPQNFVFQQPKFIERDGRWKNFQENFSVLSIQQLTRILKVMIPSGDLKKNVSVLYYMVKQTISKIANYFETSESFKHHSQSTHHHIQQKQLAFFAQINAHLSQIVTQSNKIEGVIIYIPTLSLIYHGLAEERLKINNFKSSKQSIEYKDFFAFIKHLQQKMESISQAIIRSIQWDFSLLQILYGYGLSFEGIERLMNQNIRKHTMKYLTEDDIETLNLSKLGDRLILKELIKNIQAQ